MLRRNTVDKYFKTMAIVATQSLQDRHWGLLSGWALSLLRIVILLSLWRTVLAQKGTVSGMSLDAVLTYTLAANVFGGQLNLRTPLEQDLWSGRVTLRFLRPMGFYGQLLAEAMGNWVPIFSLPLFLVAPLLGVNPLPVSLQAGLLFGCSLVFSVAVGAALDVLFAACLVFFDHSVYAMQMLRNALTTLLSGALIPLAFLPWGLDAVLTYSPFAALASAPLRIYTGTGDAAFLIPLQAVWAVVLWIAAHALWVRNRERMVAHGG